MPADCQCLNATGAGTDATLAQWRCAAAGRWPAFLTATGANALRPRARSGSPSRPPALTSHQSPQSTASSGNPVARVSSAAVEVAEISGTKKGNSPQCCCCCCCLRPPNAAWPTQQALVAWWGRHTCLGSSMLAPSWFLGLGPERGRSRPHHHGFLPPFLGFRCLGPPPCPTIAPPCGGPTRRTGHVAPRR